MRGAEEIDSQRYNENRPSDSQGAVYGKYLMVSGVCATAEVTGALRLRSVTTAAGAPDVYQPGFCQSTPVSSSILFTSSSYRG